MTEKQWFLIKTITEKPLDIAATGQIFSPADSPWEQGRDTRVKPSQGAQETGAAGTNPMVTFSLTTSFCPRKKSTPASKAETMLIQRTLLIQRPTD
ncbi:MAG: hypothetical protein U0989_14330 [Azonexus sp.]|nr:hypothetical protein [Azonexus sp.]MDP3638321.1 hypothetical protein [Azonexus sp.]MDZ4315932.1 hypothetical protein [Azonexus sp.]